MSRTIIFLLCSIIHLVFNNAVNADVPNLVAYWKLDETFGRIAYDSSNNGNDGALIDRAFWAPKGGRSHGAVSIGGHNNRGQIRIPTSGLKPQQGAIALWTFIPYSQSRVKKRARYLFCLGTTPNTVQLYFNRKDTKLNLGLGNVHKKHLNIATLNTETWYHLVVTWEKEDYAVYINDVKRAEGNYAGLNEPPPVSSLGNHPRNKGKAFHGILDEVAIFDRALTKDEVTTLYKSGVKSVLANPQLQKFMYAIEQFRLTSNQKNPSQAIAFLEKTVRQFEESYSQSAYLKRYPYYEVSFDLNSALIEAKEAAGVSQEELIKTYKKLLAQPPPYRPQIVSAILWLTENTQAGDFSTFIKDCVRNATLSPRSTYYIARHLESGRNSEVFKLFLDSVFAASNFSPYYIQAITTGIKNDETLEREFLDYFQNKPRLSYCFVAGYEKLMQDNIKHGQFIQAANLCRQIATQCAARQDQVNYEFKACKYLYDAGKYEQADSELWRFLLRNKAVNKQLTTEAIILKSLCNIQLGSLDEALGELLTAVMEYPELDKLPQMYHLIGCCYLLQAKFHQAAEVFTFLMHEYPNNFYGIRSRVFLKQIKACDS